MNKGTKYVVAVALLIMNACTTIPKPLAENIKYPHTFESVGFRSTYHQLWQIGVEHIANLTVASDRLVFRDKDIELTILFSDIRKIEYKKIYLIDPNNWVLIHYNPGTQEKMALFSTFRFLGWVGGTNEIFEAITLAYQQYKHGLAKPSSNTSQPTAYING